VREENPKMISIIKTAGSQRGTILRTLFMRGFFGR